MTVITVANIKGGVGKTTLATNVAVEGAKDGLRVLLVDADPQQSALAFRQFRAADDIAAIKPAGKIGATLRPMRDSFDLAVIDVGGSESDALMEALGAAHLVLVPVEPGQFEYLSTTNLMGKLASVRTAKEAAGLPFGARLVLNRVVPNSSIANQFDGFLSEYKEFAPVYGPRLHQRMAFKYASANGQGVTEYEPSGYAAAEMRRLWKEIKTTLEGL